MFSFDTYHIKNISLIEWRLISSFLWSLGSFPCLADLDPSVRRPRFLQMFKCLYIFARVTRKTWPAQMWAEIRITLDLKYLGVICKTSGLINLFVKNLKTKGLGTSLLLFQEIRLVVISAPHEETYRKHCPLSQPWAWIASNVVSVMRPRRVR